MSNVDIRHAGQPVPEPPPRPAVEDPKGTSMLRLGLLVGSIVLLGLWAGLSVLLVVMAIVVMIFLHELGHFVTARAAGMKCTEFFIGFGPRIWSFHRGETEYGVKAIPAGAYVRVIGMTTMEEVDPSDEERTYRGKSYWRRMSVAVAGSTMHFVIALSCLLVYFVGFGVPVDDSWEVGRLAPAADGQLSPAADAGMQVGDDIVAIDGSAVQTFDDLRDRLARNEPGDEVAVTVLRNGQRIDVSVTLGESGTGAAFLGIGPTYPPQRLAPSTAVGESVREFANYSRLTAESIVRVFSPSGLQSFLGMAVDTARPADPDAPPPRGGISEGQEDRVISIYGATRLGAQMAETGMAGLLVFLALINIFIGIFNLLPLLPLDGGHVAIATYERFRELISRSTKRYHADVSKLIPLTYVVIFVLVGVGVVALYLDIADPINLPN